MRITYRGGKTVTDNWDGVMERNKIREERLRQDRAFRGLAVPEMIMGRPSTRDELFIHGKLD